MKWVRKGGSWSQSLINPWLMRMNKRLTNTLSSSNDPPGNKAGVRRREPARRPRPPARACVARCAEDATIFTDHADCASMGFPSLKERSKIKLGSQQFGIVRRELSTLHV